MGDTPTLFETREEAEVATRASLASLIDAGLHPLIETFGFDRVEAALGRWKIAHSGPIPSAPARDEDPRTSEAQGRKMSDVRKFRATSNSGKLLREFFTAGEKGLTAYRATTLVVGPLASVSRFEGCRRRVSDLRAAEYISDTGHEEEGRIVWEITAAGSLAFANMRRNGVTR